MTSHTGTQTVTIRILSDISRSKTNYAMKFGQLIEYNMRNIFLEKWCTKCDGETSPDPFLKNRNGAAVCSFIQFVFIVCPNWGLPKHTEAKLLITCFYLIQSFLKKVSLPHFQHDFWRKMFLTLHSINWHQISLSDCLYFWKDLVVCLL